MCQRYIQKEKNNTVNDSNWNYWHFLRPLLCQYFYEHHQACLKKKRYEKKKKKYCVSKGIV